MPEVQVLDPLILNLPPGQESGGGELDVTNHDEMDSLFQGRENETGCALLDPTLRPRFGPSKNSCCAETLASRRRHSCEELDCRQKLSGLKKVIRVQLVPLR